MIVVSNTSPLMNLSLVGRLDVLSRLYGEVLAPEAVLQELSAAGIQGFGIAPRAHPAWVKVETISSPPLLASLRLELDAGEAAAIALAVELSADLVLLDERRARSVAGRMGMKYVGLLGVLLEAKAAGILPYVKALLDDLVTNAGFWVGTDLYGHVLTLAGE